MKRVAAIGLGSNLGDRLRHLSEAAAALSRVGRELQRSPVYESPPMGPVQPDYLNAVITLETELEAGDAMQELLLIEALLGRVRRERWGPRVIDLDLLCLGDVTLSTPALTVPHPGVSTRTFVLRPWADIAPDTVIPGAGTVAESLGRLPESARQSVSLFRPKW